MPETAGFDRIFDAAVQTGGAWSCFRKSIRVLWRLSARLKRHWEARGRKQGDVHFASLFEARGRTFCFLVCERVVLQEIL